MIRKFKAGVWLTAGLICILGGMVFFHFQGRKRAASQQDVSAKILRAEEQKPADTPGDGEKDGGEEEEPLTRADLGMLLFKLFVGGDIFASGAEPASEPAFRDWLLHAGGDYVVDGVPYFETLDAPVNHQEFYYALGTFLEPDLCREEEALLPDTTADWARPYIAQFHAWGFLDVSGGDFVPERQLNRKEYRKLLERIFAARIDEAKDTDARDYRKKFIVVHAAGSIGNFEQGFLILSPALSGGKLRLFDSTIEGLYILEESKNIEIQLSNSKVLSLRNRGEKIRLVDLTDTDPVPELPVTDSVKPRLSESRSPSEALPGQSPPNKNGNSSEAAKKESEKEQEESSAEAQTSESGKAERGGSPGGGSSFGRSAPKQREDLPKAPESVPAPRTLPENEGRKDQKKQESPGAEKPPEPSEAPRKEEERQPRESRESGEEKEKPGREFIILNERTRAKGELVFSQGEEIKLPESALIGLRASGENGGREYGLIWSGEDLSALGNAPKGKYELTAVTVEDLIINERNYGKVRFAVDLIIE